MPRDNTSGKQLFALERHPDPKSDLHPSFDVLGGACSSNSNTGCCNSNASGVGDNP